MDRDPRLSPEFRIELFELYAERRQLYETALRRVHESLVAVASDRSTFSVSQQRRIRIESGRVKEAPRVLAKALMPKYAGSILTARQSFDAITDIIGTRVACNTVNDVNAIVRAIRGSATLSTPAGIPSEKCYEDYIGNPKESGYRAVHLLVAVDVPLGGSYIPIICEIQVRTLLQNAWGELTHEDTFKPGVRVPSLVSALSKRLATTLAVLDEIAQDLRDELAKIEDEGDPSGLVSPLGAVAKPRARVAEQSLRSAFEDVFGRDLKLNATEVADVARAMSSAGTVTATQLHEALVDTQEMLRLVYVERPVLISDRDIMAAAAHHSLSSDAVRAAIETSAKRLEDDLDFAHQFSERYAAGTRHLGTVVRVRPRYALVQLISGETATVSARGLDGAKGVRANLEEVVAPGDSVGVEIVSCSVTERRIEARLAGLES